MIDIMIIHYDTPDYMIPYVLGQDCNLCPYHTFELNFNYTLKVWAAIWKWWTLISLCLRDLLIRGVSISRPYTTLSCSVLCPALVFVQTWGALE